MSSELVESENDVLRKDHEEMIINALTRVNDLSERINKKDSEYSYAFKQFNNYVTYMDDKLKEMNETLGEYIARTHPYYSHQKFLAELKVMANRIVAAITDYQDNRSELLEALTFAENRQNSSHSATLADLHKIDLITEEINNLEQNKNLQEQYFKAIMKKIASVNRFCTNEEKTFPKSIKKASPYYKLRNELFEGIREHRSKLKILEHDLLVLKAEYQDSMQSLEKLSDKIKEEKQVIAEEKKNPSISSASSEVLTPGTKSINESLLSHKFGELMADDSVKFSDSKSVDSS